LRVLFDRRQRSFALTQVTMGVAIKISGEIDVRVLALANAMTEGG
jgi:hypothetical protein